METKNEKKIILSKKENEALLKVIQDNLTMYRKLDDYFKDECINHMRKRYDALEEKTKEVRNITDFEEIELMHLCICLQMFASKKIKDFKSKGLDPQQDEELLFLNEIYKKLHHYFLNYDKYQ